MGKTESHAAIEARRGADEAQRKADILEARDAFLGRQGIRLSDGAFSGGTFAEVLVNLDKRLVALEGTSGESDREVGEAIDVRVLRKYIRWVKAHCEGQHFINNLSEYEHEAYFLDEEWNYLRRLVGNLL